jgi:hypothetical protein
MADASAASGSSPRCHTALADPDLPCGPALRPDRGAMRHRRPHQRSQLPGLYRAVPCAHALTRRTLSSWTIWVAIRARPCAKPFAPPVPNSSSCRPIARPQSDRAGLRKAQNASAQGRRANRRGHLATHRFPDDPLLTNRMCKSPRQHRIYSNMTGSGSSALFDPRVQIAVVNITDDTDGVRSSYESSIE